METILNLYHELEANDLNILMHVAEGSHRLLSEDLKHRTSSITAIQTWLSLNLPELSRADQLKIDQWHRTAVYRDKKIVAVVAELRDKSKREMMTTRQAGHVASPYLKKAPRARLSV